MLFDEMDLFLWRIPVLAVDTLQLLGDLCPGSHEQGKDRSLQLQFEPQILVSKTHNRILERTCQLCPNWLGLSRQNINVIPQIARATGVFTSNSRGPWVATLARMGLIYGVFFCAACLVSLGVPNLNCGLRLQEILRKTAKQLDKAQQRLTGGRSTDYMNHRQAGATLTWKKCHMSSVCLWLLSWCWKRLQDPPKMRGRFQIGWGNRRTHPEWKHMDTHSSRQDGNDRIVPSLIRNLEKKSVQTGGFVHEAPGWSLKAFQKKSHNTMLAVFLQGVTYGWYV